MLAKKAVDSLKTYANNLSDYTATTMSNKRLQTRSKRKKKGKRREPYENELITQVAFTTLLRMDFRLMEKMNEITLRGHATNRAYELNQPKVPPSKQKDKQATRSTNQGCKRRYKSTALNLVGDCIRSRRVVKQCLSARSHTRGVRDKGAAAPPERCGDYKFAREKCMVQSGHEPRERHDRVPRAHGDAQLSSRTNLPFLHAWLW